MTYKINILPNAEEDLDWFRKKSKKASVGWVNCRVGRAIAKPTIHNNKGGFRSSTHHPTLAIEHPHTPQTVPNNTDFYSRIGSLCPQSFSV